MFRFTKRRSSKTDSGDAGSGDTTAMFGGPGVAVAVADGSGKGDDNKKPGLFKKLLKYCFIILIIYAVLLHLVFFYLIVESRKQAMQPPYVVQQWQSFSPYRPWNDGFGVCRRAYNWGLREGFRYGFLLGGQECNPGNASLQQNHMLDWDLATKWVRHATPEFLSTMRDRRLALKQLPFDHLLTGLYEQTVEGDDLSAFYHYNFAASRGHQDARRLRDQLQINDEDKQRAISEFIGTHELSGSEGNYFLGMYYLGDFVWNIPNPQTSRVGGRIYFGEVKPTFYNLETWRNDFVGSTNIDQGYVHFQIAATCGHSNAHNWLTLIAEFVNYTDDQRETLYVRAQDELRKFVRKRGVSQELYCENEWPPVAIASTPSRLTPRPAIGGPLVLDPDTGAQAYRDRPGAYPKRDYGEPPARDGELCDDNVDGRCADSEDASQQADEARYYLNLGRAAMAIGDIEEARALLQTAINAGRPHGAQAALDAQKLLQALTLTCEYTEDSLSRISRNYETNPEGGDAIDLQDRQRALQAMGYYNYPVDGRYGPATREAVRQFQGDMGFDQTGALSALDTVVLICHAAQVENDRSSQTALGIMYAAGLGVVQNTDLALQYLESASRRGDRDAIFNLAMLYGTGIVHSSYKLCDIVESAERADAYLDEAAGLGHPVANDIWSLYEGVANPEERWRRIRERLTEIEFFHDRLENVGPGCAPNP